MKEEHIQIDRPFSSFIKSMLINNQPIRYKNKKEDAICHEQLFAVKCFFILFLKKDYEEGLLEFIFSFGFIN